MIRLLSWCALLATVGCAQSDPVAPGGRAEAIVDGTPTMGDHANVVAVLDRRGGLCSGSLIAPRVVLTAKHCVQGAGASAPKPPGNFIIGIGDNIRGLSETYSAQSVSTTPGVWTNGGRGLSGAIIGIDIGLIVLTRGVTSVEPIPVHWGSPLELVGDAANPVGFGQIPSGSAGRKYWGTTRVAGIMGGVIYTPSSICQGDSGGPLLTTDGAVFGVSSFGSGVCGTGTDGFNRVDLPELRALIEAALEEAGACINDGEERCDGEDNDCDDSVDEGCRDLGESCVGPSECVGGVGGALDCVESPAGRICTHACDPVRPLVGCGAGLYCARMGGCEGVCVAGEPGALVDGDACAADLDCASLNCMDPGDGARRCLTPCVGGGGGCLAAEACAAPAGACGGCVDASILIADRGLGEPCLEDGECASGACAEDLGYCTGPCTMDDDCPDAFHCRGTEMICVRGNRDGIGSGCITNEDCHTGGFCASRHGVSWCTDFCPLVECPDGYECEMVSEETGVCAPALGLVGEACASDAECLTGLCLATEAAEPGEVAERVCTRYCAPDVPCSPGFECVRTLDGASSICVTTAEDDEGGGGGCAVGGAPPPWGLPVMLGLALSFVRRRRTR